MSEVLVDIENPKLRRKLMNEYPSNYRDFHKLMKKMNDLFLPNSSMIPMIENWCFLERGVHSFNYHFEDPIAKSDEKGDVDEGTSMEVSDH